MPKIKAGSIEEHKTRQRAVILRAARKILLRDGASQLTFGAVSKAAKIPRTSIYDYFHSTDELILGLLEEEWPSWLQTLSNAVEGEQTPRGCLLGFVRAQLTLVLQGKHEIGFVLTNANLSTEVKQQIEQLHQQLFSLIQPSLEELAGENASLLFHFVVGVMSASSEAIRRTERPELALAFILSLLDGGIERLSLASA
jgi:AcrR family transcriptional regulator